MAKLTATTVEIDPNTRLGRNQTVSRISHANGALAVGETVVALEPESGLSGPATVSQIDLVRGFVYLEIDWSELTFGSEPSPVAQPGEVARMLVNGSFGPSVHLPEGAYLQAPTLFGGPVEPVRAKRYPLLLKASA